MEIGAWCSQLYEETQQEEEKEENSKQKEYQHLLMGVWTLPGQASDIKKALLGGNPGFIFLLYFGFIE